MEQSTPRRSHHELALTTPFTSPSSSPSSSSAPPSSRGARAGSMGSLRGAAAREDEDQDSGVRVRGAGRAGAGRGGVCAERAGHAGRTGTRCGAPLRLLPCSATRARPACT